MDYLSEVLELLEDSLSVSVNKDTTSSNTENWDSLAQVTIIAGIEERFDIEIAYILSIYNFSKDLVLNTF